MPVPRTAASAASKPPTTVVCTQLAADSPLASMSGSIAAVNLLRGVGVRSLALGLSTPFLDIGCADTYPDSTAALAAVEQASASLRRCGLPKRLCPFVIAVAGQTLEAQGAMAVFKLLPVEHVRWPP